MTTSAHPRRRPLLLFAGFGVVALLIAGLLSYFAYPHPDGLDTVILQGCTEVTGGEQLSGDCIAQRADDHALADSPLADYTVRGDEGLLGVSGVVGVLVTLVVAGGLFWLLRPRRADRSRDGDTG
ncbi:MAG: hypothetical protein GEV09_20505 [Pseudonocardiaceae bacterium]|nr:hypothetical protein [Pseudonocardiaceae bacterium]